MDAPGIVKRSFDGGGQEEIAAIDSDFEVRPRPLSLMEYADNALIICTRSRRDEHSRFTLSRSDLVCHHLVIA